MSVRPGWIRLGRLNIAWKPLHIRDGAGAHFGGWAFEVRVDPR